MSTVNNLEDAYDDAIRVFDGAGVDTDIVDDAYNTANSWTEAAYAAWAATDDAIAPADVKAAYQAHQASTFWTTLAQLYADKYQVSDKISAYLESASYSADKEATNAYGQRVGGQAIGEALAQTGQDIKNAGKIGIPAILIAGGLFLWLTSGKGR